MEPEGSLPKRRLSGESKEGKRKSRKTGGKACVYCRRSHMVCEGGRPCDRCIKRDISHLCRDALQDTVRGSNKNTEEPEDIKPVIPDPPSQSQSQQQTQLPPQLYSDPNFPPSWPLLPDTTTNTGATFVDGTVGNMATAGGSGSGSGGGGGQGGMQGMWGLNDESELGALSKYLGELGVPSLPGSFLDVLSYFSRDQAGSGTGTGDGNGSNGNGSGNGNTIQMSEFTNQPSGSTASGPNQTNYNNTLGTAKVESNSNSNGHNGINLAQSQPSDTSAGVDGRKTSMSAGANAKGKGKGKETPPVNPLNISGMSRIERYFLAAADQPSGPRHSRLAQVIKAKYDAGLLKPYDYIKGYERMNKWMDSGRAAPRQESVSGSAPSSPIRGERKSRMVSATPNPSGSSISPESRRRILAALNGFRPKFRQIARTLTDVDLVFVEEAMERWMLEYDRAFASIHTPSCIWRRTGEIQKANQEFANLLQIPASMFRSGQLCVYELMDEDSAVRYWEGYGKIAFDAGQRSIYTTTTLKIPQSLTRHPTTTHHQDPPLAPTGRPPVSQGEVSDTGSALGLTLPQESYREIKCCFSVTIRRDAWGVPVAIMGQWIPI